MLDFDTALNLVLRDLPPPAAESVGLGDARARVLASDLLAARPLPAFDYSAMDGYAVRSSELATLPVSLPVLAESRAGSAPFELAEGRVCRIFTGAPIPVGADAVVMQEDVTRTDDAARFTKAVRVGEHIRRAGEDLAVGQLALAAGTRLDPFHLGLAAALDEPTLAVAKAPRVNLLCTGDELRPVGQPGPVGTIPDSNSVALTALMEQNGAAVSRCPNAPDEPEELTRLLLRALDSCHLLVTVGGVSVGDRDIVRPALERAGVETVFHKVRLKPGKPLYFGRRGSTRVLGLPGSPVSAQLCFALFGVPLLRALQGVRSPALASTEATLTADIRQKPGRRSYYRGVLEGNRITPVGNQASGASTSSAWANALVVVDEAIEHVPSGSSVTVIPYRAFA